MLNHSPLVVTQPFEQSFFMAEAKQLCVVEDAFFITGRGPVILTKQWRMGHLRPGNWIELHSVEGDCHSARVKSIEMVRFMPGLEELVDAQHPGGLLLADIGRDGVKVGDAVWTASDPPSTETAVIRVRP